MQGREGKKQGEEKHTNKPPKGPPLSLLFRLHLCAHEWVWVHDARRQTWDMAVAHGCEVGHHIGQGHQDVVAGDGRGGPTKLLPREGISDQIKGQNLGDNQAD